MCKTEGCFQEKTKARGLCSKCYYHDRKHGDARAGRRWGTCAKGHDLTNPENVVVIRTRQCKICLTEARRSYKLFYNFKMTEESWEELFDSQGRACALCCTKDSEKWCVDHDHSCCPDVRTCGKCVRGILCSACNYRMRAVDEWNEDTLLKAVTEYRHARPILQV